MKTEILPDEDEIRRHWSVNGGPVVTIVCTTFNHCDYLQDAMHGFLIQKTEFPFEIVVHDDASTDKTVDIIDDYAKRYPNLIRPVLQQENQFSKGKRVIALAAVYANGRYVAICEGDDYWFDPDKLQRQVDAMMTHPQCGMSFHPAIVIHEGENEEKEDRTYLKTGDRVFSTSEIIRGGGGFCPTASQMYKNKVLTRMPDWFEEAPVGDQFFQILGAVEGGALYIDRPMSVYRKMARGAWSEKMTDLTYALEHNRKRVHCLELFNKELNGTYDREFRFQKAFWAFKSARMHLRHGDIVSFRQTMSESWGYYRHLSWRQTVWYVLRMMPGLQRFHMYARRFKERTATRWN